MDRLIHPAGTSLYIMVPYKCTENYDGDDVFTYPERKSWAPRHRKLRLQSTHSSIASILSDIAILWMPHAGAESWHHTKASALITQWKSHCPTSKDVSDTCQCNSVQSYAPDQRCGHERCWESVVRDRNSNALRTTCLILRAAFTFIDLIRGMEGIDLAFGEDPISALGSALFSTSDVVYECPHLLEWGGAAIMKERLQRVN
ncbi:hypothetical protein EDC04DRAFT_3138280 [Pisolithus marmoratus]|nr:hypothetical protein EDC04DRAFT_3138280 [Pisolithus marmoratus]